MTGLPEHGFPAFSAAAAAWRAAGWQVLNPAESFSLDGSLPYSYYVEHDVFLLLSCDAIAMLPGWNDSQARGSVWEYFIAKILLNIPVFDATKPLPPDAVDALRSNGLTTPAT
jgi:hypothetical protein